MRFIHTADWHLGRSFFNVSLIDDQAYVLNQLIQIGRETKPHGHSIASVRIKRDGADEVMSAPSRSPAPTPREWRRY